MTRRATILGLVLFCKNISVFSIYFELYLNILLCFYDCNNLPLRSVLTLLYFVYFVFCIIIYTFVANQ